jgi:hypothetical protein
MGATSESQQGQLGLSKTTANHNSPVVYGLGSLGLESLFQVFAGFYVFYYTDKLGLAVTLGQAKAMAPDRTTLLHCVPGIGVCRAPAFLYISSESGYAGCCLWV